MSKQDLKKSILEWRERELKIIKRNIPFKITSEITTIIGPRRSGKTYFMYQIAELLRGEFGIESMIYIDFEDPLCKASYAELMDVINELIPDKGVLFLDEIQIIPDWPSWLRGLHNQERFHIFVSGSSSKLLGHEIATSLRGRSITQVVFPFSFREISEYEGVKQSRINALLNKYLEWGGFPRVYLSNEKSELLKTYLETIFLRDIVERYRLRDIEGARIFRDLIMRNLSQEFSISKASRVFKSMNMSKSKRSLTQLLRRFEESFLIFTIPRFSHSQRGIIQMPKKVYPIDVGLFHPYSSFSESITRRFEALIAIELYKRNLLLNERVFYFRTHHGYEVDFVRINNNGVEQLIQACYDISEPKTRKREERGLKKAAKELGCNDLLVITWDLEEKTAFDGFDVYYEPLWKWLSENSVY